MVLILAGLASLSASAAPSAPPATVTCTSIVQLGGQFSWRPTRVVLGVVDVPPRHIA
jgi:hypothetical protein